MLDEEWLDLALRYELADGTRFEGLAGVGGAIWLCGLVVLTERDMRIGIQSAVSIFRHISARFLTGSRRVHDTTWACLTIS